MIDRIESLFASLESLERRGRGFWTRSACGVTRSEREIPALLDRDAYVPATSRARVLLVSGLSGRPDDVAYAVRALGFFVAGGPSLAGRIALSSVPCGNPDGLAADSGLGNGAGGDPSGGYPPEGSFFHDQQNPETRHLWRWICFQAPDLVLEVQFGSHIRWESNQAARPLAPAVGATPVRDDGSLLAALGAGNPNGLGPIPGLRLTAPPHHLAGELGRLWSLVPQFPGWEPSQARRALDSRRSRSKLRVASILDTAYGRHLDPVVYTQGVPISGRLRLARLGPNSGRVALEIASMLDESGLSTEDPFGDRPRPSNLAGVLWGADLSEATGDPRWAQFLVNAADRFQPGEPGTAPPPSDPDFRTEDMFMNGAILGRAFRVNAKESYLELLIRFLLDAGIQQENGLFWHCRSVPFFWGRGNGFAAMGLTETLTYLPEDHPFRPVILSMYLRHMEAVRRRQQPSGMFPQVLNVPGSYQEFTATCMFGYAMARGLRRGWLDESFLESVRQSWQGVTERIDDEGNVVDACTNTGAQGSLRDYLDRPAVSGIDDRSGGMALWFAVELERLAGQ
jgi:rhamnogalacturonyl hydrolase YesR